MMDKRYPNNIRKLRDERDVTLETLSEVTGLSTGYLSRLESGERNLSVKNLNLIADGLKVAPRELLIDDNPAPQTNVVRVMGRIGAGAEILVEGEDWPEDGLFEIEAPFPVPEDSIAFEVQGESMWPRYDPGDIIICWRTQSHVDEVIGWEAAVKTADGRRYLKRVLRGATRTTFDLESHNAAPIRGVKLDWVGAIQAVIRSGQWRKLSEDGRRRLLPKMSSVA